VTRRGGVGQRRLAVGDGSARRKCWFKKDAGSSNKKAGASANVSGSKDWEGRSRCWSVLLLFIALQRWKDPSTSTSTYNPPHGR
jgi:hypothetical protein